MLGREYLDEGNQVKRHLAVLNGQGGDPWQYRVLAPYMIQPMVALFQRLGVNHFYAISFLLFRVLQDTAIFAVGFLYYRKLGLSAAQALVGISLLAWGVSYSHFDSDLQFNTAFDILFFLLAGFAVWRHRRRL